MSFREEIEKRIRAQFVVHDAPGQNGYGTEYRDAALFGARAALLLAAEECLAAEAEHERHSKSIAAREALVMMHCYQEEDRRLADRLKSRAEEVGGG